MNKVLFTLIPKVKTLKFVFVNLALNFLYKGQDLIYSYR